MPDLKGGEQRQDVRFIQFDNVVIELLQYRDAAQPMGTGASWAEPRDHMSPAYPRSMHICFYIRDDVDFNQFIRDLETESATEGKSNGWSLIYCKGPEGEQLEFVQALGPVKKTFADALEARRRLVGIAG